MQNTKLIQLMKTLSPAEFKQFKDFVYSPIFNKNKKVIAVFESLRKFYPEFNSSQMTDEKIFIKIFPGEKYDYFKLKNISSDLFAIGKEFLMFLYYQDKPDYNYKDIFLLSQLRTKNLDNMFQQNYKALLDRSDDALTKDENFFFKRFLLLQELSFFYSPKEPNQHLYLFQDIFDNFLKYSLIRLLKFYNIMLHEKRQNNFDYDLKMFDEVFKYLKRNRNENNPTLLIYYYIILLEKEKEEGYFFELKKLKDKYFDQLNNTDKYMYFLHMSGYCAYVFNVLGRTNFMREHFLLSKENFDKGTMELGKILYMDFLNHVKIAVRVDEFEWAANYINAFKDKLTEEKESTLNFCYGYINYKKGNLNEALDLLSRANFPNFIIKIQVKILLLQVYFEKEFYEQALAMIDTFRHYLSREKSIVEDFKESFFDYLRITGELIKVKTRIDNKNFSYNIISIRKDIEDMRFNHFGIKNWLKEQLSKLKVKS